MSNIINFGDKKVEFSEKGAAAYLTDSILHTLFLASRNPNSIPDPMGTIVNEMTELDPKKVSRVRGVLNKDDKALMKLGVAVFPKLIQYLHTMGFGIATSHPLIYLSPFDPRPGAYVNGMPSITTMVGKSGDETKRIVPMGVSAMIQSVGVDDREALIISKMAKPKRGTLYPVENGYDHIPEVIAIDHDDNDDDRIPHVLIVQETVKMFVLDGIRNYGGVKYSQTGKDHNLTYIQIDNREQIIHWTLTLSKYHYNLNF